MLLNLHLGLYVIGVSLTQEAILEVQHLERLETDFSRVCLFCSQMCSGNRADLFQHMLEAHTFNVGQPDNLGRPVPCTPRREGKSVQLSIVTAV